MKNDRHPAYRPYLYCIAGVGFTLFALSVWEMARAGVSVYWLGLALLTAVISTLAIKIPGIDSKISIEDTLFFTTLVLFGSNAGIVTAGLQGLTGSLRVKSAGRRLEYALFNVGALTLCAYITGHVFFSLLGRKPLITGSAITWGKLAFPIAAMALVHYLCNSSTVATIIALDSRERIYRVWAKNFRWTSLSYITGASVAALIAVNLRSGNLAALVSLVPVLATVFFAYKNYKDKLEGQIQGFKELSALYLRIVESLALAVDAKDQTTYGHIRRVRAYALGLARLCKVSDKNELLAIDTGSLLHDIGKLAVDDYILNKPGRLNPKEFEAMKIHTIAGEEIVNQIQFPFPVAKIVRSHHERWDGRGYPDGLAGEEIPLGARILTISDTFDALRSPRPYKPARSIEESIEELRACVGSMYDPKLAEIFLNNIEQLELEAEEAVRNMPKMSFRSYFGKPDPAIRVPAPPLSVSNLPQSLKSSEELISFCEFCISLARQLSLPDLLVNLECRLRRLVPFTAWAFFLDDGNNTLTVAHAGGRYAEQLRNIRVNIGSGVSGWVAAYGRPMVNSKAILEFESMEGDFSSITNALVVPVKSEGACFGTISLYSEASINYTEDHLGILQVVSNQIAPVLQEAQQRALSPSEALVDPVTNAYQAPYLAYAGKEMIASCQESVSRFSLVYLDLQNFQDIVDTHGLHAGDLALRRVAETLRSEIRERDTLIRFGLQGFVLLFSDVQKEQIANRVQRFGLKIQESDTDHLPALVCQAGAATYPENGHTIFALLDAARRDMESQSMPALHEAGKHKILEFSPTG
jgi:diguanylate cyclase (GGDEF)-like protein/putative nucleotidyltransferase with HDIG domain